MSLFLYSLAKDGKDIEISDRNVELFNGKPSEVFTNPLPVKALVKTLTGVTVFDSTNTETIATHEMRIEFIAGITAEKWILFKGKRIRILTVDNCCENDEVLILMCTERGLDSKVVNDA